MKSKVYAALAMAVALTSVASAQYGLMENYEGTDRFANNVNLNDGANFTYGGSSGGGEGAVDPLVREGEGGYGWGTGAAFSDGFGIQVAATAGFIDLTQTVNGMTSTGYTIKMLNVDGGGAGSDDGNVIDFIVEDDTALPGPGQEIFSVSGLLVGTAQTLTFTAGTGVAGANGTANRARFKQFIVRASNLGSGGNSNLNVDNIGFTGNLVPTSYSVENFDALTIGTLAGGGSAGTVNTFGGAVTTFAYGAGAVTGASLVTVSGPDQALQVSWNGLEGGLFFDLGPATGSQTDVSAATGVSFDIASAEAGQAVTVFVETIDARQFADRWAFTITPGTTLANVQIPFASLTSPSLVTFAANRVHRISFVPATADAGAAGVSLQLNNLAFYGVAGVADWTAY